MIIGIGFLINLNNKIILKNTQILYEIKQEEAIDSIPNTLVVINNTEYNLEAPTKIILNNTFSHDSLVVKFEYMPDEFTHTHAAFVIADFFFENHYVVYMSKYLEGHRINMVLVHELIHIDQFESGDLQQHNFYTGIYIYKGDTINNDTLEHDERPFEIDAMNREEGVYYSLFDSL